MENGYLDLKFEFINGGCLGINPISTIECSNGIPNFIGMPVLSKEAAVRLAHKGIFPLEAETTLNGFDAGCHYIYLKDKNGSIVGTSIQVDSLLIQPTPNNNLTKQQKKQLKELGLL